MSAVIEAGTDPRAQAVLQEVQVVENRLALYVEPGGQKLVVTTAEAYREAAQELVKIKAASKRLEDTRLEMTRPIDAAKRTIMDFFDAPKQRLLQAARRIGDALSVYEAEQRRIAQERQREAEEQARRDREFNEQRAARAVERGDFETAEGAQQAAATVVAPVLAPKIPDVKGLVNRTNWTYDVIDESLVPREYLTLDRAKITAHVKVTKGDTKIPGIQVREETVRAGTGR